MNVYRVSDPGEADIAPIYCATLDACRAQVKETPAPFRCALRVVLFEVPTTKEAVLFLLNHPRELPPGTRAVATWRPTVRGGLHLHTES